LETSGKSIFGTKRPVGTDHYPVVKDVAITAGELLLITVPEFLEILRKALGKECSKQLTREIVITRC
jgi:hypothetical protein